MAAGHVTHTCRIRSALSRDHGFRTNGVVRYRIQGCRLGGHLSTHAIRIEVNGRPVEATVTARRLLVDFLRDELGLTGTKEGCGVGVCGACSVLVDGDLMSACLLPMVLVDGASVQTVEGLADGENPSALQDEFIRRGGFQCGICTPGQLVAASALLAECSVPDETQVRRWMMGNLCRCTGYNGIVEAILSTSRRRREEVQPEL